MFGFHLFKIGIHLLLFIYSEDTSILIIGKKEEEKKQGIKQADKKIKMCLDFIILKIGVQILLFQ